jgi:hypothetical protein
VKPSPARTSNPRPDFWSMLVSSAFLLRLLPAVFLLTAGSALAGSLEYKWAAGELYRFNYARSVEVRQPDETGRMRVERTSLTGVIIIEIRSVTNGVASALMRFDVQELALPPLRSFTAQSDEISESDKIAETHAHAMEAMIKAARWTITLFPDGSVRTDSRVPEKLSEWTKELAGMARWRARLSDVLSGILENDAGLRVGATSTDLFYASKPTDLTKSENGGAYLRPVRSETSIGAGKKKIEIGFERVRSPKAPEDYIIPGMDGNVTVHMKVDKVATQSGSAVFDARLGMLDALNETYTSTQSYKLGADSIQQDVLVAYSLKRLAPTITPAE